MRRNRPRALLLSASLLATPATVLAQGFVSDFELGLAADGWTVDNVSGAVTWTDLPGLFGDLNYVNRSENAPIANSDGAGSGQGPFDTYLISPRTLLSGPVTLKYETNFQNFLGGLDRMEVLYSIDGGSWTLLFSHTEDTPSGGLFIEGAGDAFRHDFEATGDAVQVAFRYADESTDAWEWYAQVDNVALTPAPGAAALLLAGLPGRRRRR